MTVELNDLERVVLTCHAVDQSGAEVPLPQGPIAWAVSDPTVAAVDTISGAQVSLRPLAPGAVTVTVRLTKANGVVIRGSTDVVIAPDSATAMTITAGIPS